MGNNKSAYEAYRIGIWCLIGVCAVTAVNYLLAVFSMTLYFPFSAYIPRELIARWGSGDGAAMIFVAGMYNDIEYDMEDRRYAPLRTPYRFEQQAEHTTHRNVQWVRVNYSNNFTITVE